VRRQCAQQAERIVTLEVALDEARADALAATARSAALTTRSEHADGQTGSRTVAKAVALSGERARHEQSKQRLRESELARSEAETEVALLRLAGAAAQEEARRLVARAREAELAGDDAAAEARALRLELTAVRETASPLLRERRRKLGERGGEGGADAGRHRGNSPVHRSSAPSAEVGAGPLPPQQQQQKQQQQQAAWALAWAAAQATQHMAQQHMAAAALLAGPLATQGAMQSIDMWPMIGLAPRPGLRRALSFDRLARIPGLRMVGGDANAYGRISPQH